MRFAWIPIALLIALNAIVWTVPTPRGFSVSFLDVGQGDAIFIQNNNVQLLVDGGPDASVLRELGTVMPVWDRTIDAVLETHPDKDHIGGLIDVFDRYDIGTFLEPGISHDSNAVESLKRAVKNETGVTHVLARSGMRLILGRNAYADALYPDKDVSNVETNSGSVILHVVYGDTSFMLTGDSPSEIEKYLVSIDGDALHSDVLKAGHHGSRTSSAPAFIDAVDPSFVVFSRGCDNTYGHPAPDVVERYKTRNITTLDTCELGAITFASNGKVLRVEH